MKAEQLTPEQVLSIACLAVEALIEDGKAPDKNSSDEFAQAAYWLAQWKGAPPSFAGNGRAKKNGKVKAVVNQSMF